MRTVQGIPAMCSVETRELFRRFRRDIDTVQRHGCAPKYIVVGRHSAGVLSHWLGEASCPDGLRYEGLLVRFDAQVDDNAVHVF